ncbi:glycosyltransferase family 2 protein [Gordonia amicalis]|uniref:glycosyltransferase family 2 protein n=1 Tax=Gordonia amicalis TaxID=89053 RepID=UPI00187C447E
MKSGFAVSAIIPSTGRAELAAAVNSVVSQTIAVRPIVVLDRPEMESSVRSMLSSVDCLLVVTEGLGGAGARNVGIDRADTEFVAFLDDDDSWLPMKTEVQLEQLGASASRRVLAASGMRFIRSRDEIVIPRRVPVSRDIGSYLVQRPRLRFGDNCVQSSSLLLRREFAQDVGWDVALKKHQDWDFIIRALEYESSELAWTSSPLVNVRQGTPGSISRTRSWRDSLLFFEKHREHMSSRACADFLWTQILRSSFATGDAAGIRFFVSRMGDGVPNLAAALVGVSGLASLRPLGTRFGVRR